MGHTDVVPVCPAGWSATRSAASSSTARSGAAAPSTCSTSRRRWRSRPSTSPARLAAAGHAGLPRRGRRGGRRRARCRVARASTSSMPWSADYVVTESGGWTVHGAGGRRRRDGRREGGGLAAPGVHGTPGHASMPFGADNALVKAAEVVRRIADVPSGGRNQRRLAGVGRRAATWPPRRGPPSSTRRGCGTVRAIPDPGTAKYAHACTHTTFSPNVVQGGTKTNVIPDEVELDIDIRTLPGQSGGDVDRMLADALGRSRRHVTVEPLHDGPAQSPRRHAAVGRHARRSRRPAVPTPRSCPASPPAAPTPPSSASAAPSRTGSGPVQPP